MTEFTFEYSHSQLIEMILQLQASVQSLEQLLNHCQEGIEKCFERIEYLEKLNK